ncbi:hypothetical protein ACFV9G_05365 [Nocardioides sp. NPDC059952]|uniref:hypothetical protein n=1 Tax=Nocardioides sp. NPDC059952 TaxID=3347014 RepID=UPI0036671EBC
MNSIEDLRTTLATHADRAGDSAAVRSGSVHRRIRKVRTLRRGVVAAVAAAVIAGAGLVALLPGLGRPPVAGLPGEVTALHFTYDLAETEVLEVGADRDQIKVAAPSDDGHWAVAARATGLETGTATVYINDEPVLRIRGEERSALYPIPYHDRGRISVEVTDAPDGGKVSLGLYERTGLVVGDGVSRAGRLFPTTYGGATLLGGEFGDPDDTLVRYSFRASGRPIAIAPLCQDPAGAFEFGYRIDGKEIGRGNCSDESVDLSAPDLAISQMLQRQLSRGRHTVTLVAERQDGSTNPPEDVAVHLGVAVYEVGEQVDLGAMKTDRITEQDGRRWQVDRVVPISKTRTFSTMVSTGRRPALVGYLTCGWSVTVRVTSRNLDRGTDPFTSSDNTGGCGYTVGSHLPAYDTYNVALETTKDELGTSAKEQKPFEGAVVVYRPVD